MFQKVDSYVIDDGFTLKIGKKRLNGWAASRYFSNFLFDLGKIDLPRITHAKVQIEIRILSVICSLITRWLH